MVVTLEERREGQVPTNWAGRMMVPRPDALAWDLSPTWVFGAGPWRSSRRSDVLPKTDDMKGKSTLGIQWQPNAPACPAW
jgi:hypothetical protein